MNLQRAGFQVPGFLKGNEFTLKKVYILLPSFFLPPARIPPGTERVLLCNHLHSQKCMRRDSHFSHVGPNFLSLESPPCCLSLVLGPELFPYPPPCCSLSACGINNSPSKLHTPPNDSAQCASQMSIRDLPVSGLWTCKTVFLSVCLWMLVLQLCACHRLLSHASLNHFVFLMLQSTEIILSLYWDLPPCRWSSHVKPTSL